MFLIFLWVFQHTATFGQRNSRNNHGRREGAWPNSGSSHWTAVSGASRFFARQTRAVCDIVRISCVRGVIKLSCPSHGLSVERAKAVFPEAASPKAAFSRLIISSRLNLLLGPIPWLLFQDSVPGTRPRILRTRTRPHKPQEIHYLSSDRKLIRCVTLRCIKAQTVSQRLLWVILKWLGDVIRCSLNWTISVFPLTHKLLFYRLQVFVDTELFHL